MLKTFIFLATFYHPDGAVIHVLDTQLTGEDCIARMEHGLTNGDIMAIQSNGLVAGEGHRPPAGTHFDISTAVLSCEFDW